MFLFTFLSLFAVAFSADRMCCKYRCPYGSSECADWCIDETSCTIRNGSQLITDSECTVKNDSKKDEPDQDSRETCLKMNLASSRQKFENLPFYLKPYVYMMPGSHVAFTGLDLRYQYNTFNKLTFRLKNMNQNVCPERTEFLANSPCNPRCVVIDRSNSLPIPGLLDNLSFLSYDCEVGFYISGKGDKKSWIETSGDDYLLSVCADRSSGTVCGEYTFQVPSPLHLNKTDDPPVIVLIDKQEFENKDKIVIYVPTSQKADTFSVSVLLVSDNQSSTVVRTQENPIPPGAGPVLKILVEHNIPSGRYQIAVTPKRGGLLAGTPSYSAYLTRPNYGEHALVIITAILAIIILVGFILGVYKRWQQVAEESAIEPCQLVEAGRIRPRPILVITSLDDSDHAQIVKELCSYLREWCGVGESYYPLDDVSGIHCGQRDPWKWAQNSYEKVKENGTVVFIAGPTPNLSPSTSLYPGIQDNQAFLATQDMRVLAKEGRVLVCKFAYSDLKTLAEDVPQHLVSSALTIPKHMNTFLSQLLQVRKKTLCSVFPISLVQPDILPRDFTRQGGADILAKIRKLTVKEHNWRLELAARTQNTPLDRFLKSQNEDGKGRQDKSRYITEDKGGREDKVPLCEDQDREKKNSVLDIRLEGDMPSVRQMSDRDRSTAETV